MTFEGYLVEKKINIDLFREAEPNRFEEWQRLFVQIHPESFTAQKKFLINRTRRKYAVG